MERNKIILLLCVMICALSASAQIYTKPNPGLYGIGQNRGYFDSTLFYPTGCGAPSGTTALYSYGTNGQGQILHKSALYFDSCGHKPYFYDPSSNTWLQGGGGGSGGSDTALQSIQQSSDSLSAIFPKKDGSRYIIKFSPQAYNPPGGGGSTSTQDSTYRGYTFAGITDSLVITHGMAFSPTYAAITAGDVSYAPATRYRLTSTTVTLYWDVDAGSTSSPITGAFFKITFTKP